MGDEDLGEATVARTAQLMAVIAMVAEHTIRVRDQRAHRRAVADEQATSRLRVARRAEHAHARTGYGPALEPGWARTADTAEAARAWGAARPWAAQGYPDAQLAVGRAEQRLRRLQPYAMAHYDLLRRQGSGDGDAMAAAAAFMHPPGAPVVGGQRQLDSSAAAQAGADWAHAQRDRATPDVAVTPADEHTIGVAGAARHTTHADTAAAAAHAGQPTAVAPTRARAVAARQPRAQSITPVQRWARTTHRP